MVVDAFNPRASVIVFQYNPMTLTRTFTAQMFGERGTCSEVPRLKGSPQEEINVTVEIDATDQLESGKWPLYNRKLNICVCTFICCTIPPPATLS